MGTPVFRYFDKYAVEEKGGNIRINDENQKMVMIGIQCEDEHTIELHQLFRHLSMVNESIPMVQPPSVFGNSNVIRMAVRCGDGKIIDNLNDKWFFEFALSYNISRKNWDKKPFYATLIFKRVILNLVSIVKSFLQTNFRPVLLARKIFVTKAGDVIFSQYERRDPSIHDSVEEARQLGDLLKALVRSKVGNYSATLTAEFEELATWLLTTNFQPGSDVREQVVFWDQRIRIHYIGELFEEVCTNYHLDAQIFQYSKNAFKVGSQTNWRQYLVNTNRHPVLCELLRIGDRHFLTAQRNSQGPSHFRSNITANKTDAEILCCGLAKMRDGYSHDGLNADNFKVFYKEHNLRDIHLQALFQDVFPSHMVEFARSKHLIGFRAEKFVQQLLDRTYIEDASSSVDKYLA